MVTFSLLPKKFRASEQYKQCNRAKIAVPACDDIGHPIRLKKVQSLPRQMQIAALQKKLLRGDRAGGHGDGSGARRGRSGSRRRGTHVRRYVAGARGGENDGEGLANRRRSANYGEMLATKGAASASGGGGTRQHGDTSEGGSCEKADWTLLFGDLRAGKSEGWSESRVGGFGVEAGLWYGDEV